jgi:arsenate reductase
MTQRDSNVLFLCTGNSARSIMAEALLNKAGGERFRAFSAGSHPTGRVNPNAVRLLSSLGYPTSDLSSKSWDEFTAPDAPVLDIVITVCDNAAGETCPLWPGGPAKAHWGFPDPAGAEGNEAEIGARFLEVFNMLSPVIERLVALPVESLDSAALRARLGEIGPQ